MAVLLAMNSITCSITSWGRFSARKWRTKQSEAFRSRFCRCQAWIFLIRTDLEIKTFNNQKIKSIPILLPGQVWDHHSCKSVDETDDGETNEEHPPHPEDKEVLLVEDVVVKNAKIVGPVNSSSGGTNVDVTRDLRQ